MSLAIESKGKLVAVITRSSPCTVPLRA
jgi:hypothetical protein